MIYLVYGSQSPTIKSKIKKIAKNNLPFVDDINFVKFDASESLIQEVVDECNYLPLGYEHKVISLENAYFLIKDKGKNKIEGEQNYDEFIKYLNSPNSTTDLIVSVISSSLDEKSEIVKLLRKKATIIEAKDPDEKTYKDYIKRYIVEKLNVTIDNDALNELAIRTAGDVALMKNSADKLALYTSHITYDDVSLMVQRPLEEKVYNLFNYLLAGKNVDALLLYKDLRVSNAEPVTLISMLANQFRLLSEVIYLSKNGFTYSEIGKELGINEIRAKILAGYSYSIGEQKLIDILEDLYNLDLNIKSGLVDRFYAFELFLINF